MAESIIVPVLPLRDVVVYPHMVIPLFVGRNKSIQALDMAMDSNKQILLVAQKSAEVDAPELDDVHTMGTLATILQLLKLPDGTLKVLVEGLERAEIIAIDNDGDFSAARVKVAASVSADSRKIDVLSRSLVSLFEQYVKLNKKVPPEILSSLSSIDDPVRLADTIAAHLGLKIAEKQKVLEMLDVEERIQYLMELVEGEIDLLQVEKRFGGALSNRWNAASVSITSTSKSKPSRKNWVKWTMLRRMKWKSCCVKSKQPVCLRKPKTKPTPS